MNFLKTRVLPLFLSVITAVSLMVPVSAGFGAVELPDPFEPASFFDPEWFASEMNRLYGDQSADHCAFFSEFAYIANKNNWTTTTKDNLALLATYWNMSLGPQYSSTAAVGSHTLDDGTQLYYVRVMIDDERLNGGRRNWNWCLNDGAGCILVALPEEDPDTSISALGHWEELNSATLNTSVKHLEHYKDLANAAQDLGGRLLHHGNYWFITKTIGLKDYLLFNPDNQIYATVYEEDMWATGQNRPQTEVKDEVGDIVDGVLEGLNSGIDLGSMTITLPDGTINLIDKIIYDESTKSYHIDSHDTYNYTVNNYYTWNYYINYTSITYIGQTEEYNKYYEVYYELPDGRSSADLTKEDLEQLNLSVDVIPYGRSADDTSLRSLYHFDGDTKDSSYWNYCTDFRWNKGASLTYMDAGVFNGALYLDETEHDFSLTLPSNISSSDFTLQFRYYQSATPAPVTDSYVKIGGDVVVQFDGANLKTHDDIVISQMPVGSWNEIAIIRKGSSFKIYLNGVLCSSSNYLASTPLNWDVTFHFGSSQQTFKYLDEVRFLNYALTSASTYTPTAVPYDTNLTLVLPDSAVPIADEYWSFDQTIAPVWSQDFSTGYSGSFAHSGFTNLEQIFSEFKNRLLYVGKYTTITETQGFTSVLTNNSSMFKQSQDGGGLVFPISGGDTSRKEYWDFTGTKYKNNSSSNVGQYTFSVVTRDGETYSLTFNMFYPVAMEDGFRASASFDWGNIYYVEASNSSPKWTYIWVLPKAGVPMDFVYMELVKGSTPNTGHEFVQSVTGIDRDNLNTPTLAVRTDIDITSYQIGGVRPSLPEKGMVWAMVENERIASLQIYNGQAWEGVDGRIWTGERWIPMSSYNIITLQDLYDIVDATPNYEYIYSEAGFWSWWQKSWNAFQEKLFQALGSGGSGGGSIVPGTVKQEVSEALSSLIEGIFGTITEVLKSLIGAAQDLLSGIFSFFSDTVFGGIRDFFSSFDELINPFETTIENEDGSTTTAPGLPDDVVTGLGFFSGLIMLIPDEVRVVLFFFAGLTLFIAILKRFA